METSKPPSLSEDDIVHVVNYDVVTLRDNDEIETLAKSTLMSTLESAEHGAAGDDIAYGNPRGLTVLSEMNRFLDIYRRDIIRDLDYKGRHNIAKGNEAAHYGDAVADAALYTSGERLDRGILLEIYGLDFEHIASLTKAGESDIIKVLNAGATWRANQSTTTVPLDVEAALTTFIKKLSRSQSFSKESLTDGTIRLSKAYYAFWTAHKAHKK